MTSQLHGRHRRAHRRCAVLSTRHAQCGPVAIKTLRTSTALALVQNFGHAARLAFDPPTSVHVMRKPSWSSCTTSKPLVGTSWQCVPPHRRSMIEVFPEPSSPKKTMMCIAFGVLCVGLRSGVFRDGYKATWPPFRTLLDAGNASGEDAPTSNTLPKDMDTAAKHVATRTLMAGSARGRCGKMSMADSAQSPPFGRSSSAVEPREDMQQLNKLPLLEQPATGTSTTSSRRSRRGGAGLKACSSEASRSLWPASSQREWC